MSTSPDLITLGDLLAESIDGMSWYKKEDIKPLSDGQLERLKRADQIAGNASVQIHDGIAGMGKILGSIGGLCETSDSDKIDPDILSARDLLQVGWLIHSLSRLAENLCTTAHNVAYIQKQQISINRIDPFDG